MDFDEKYQAWINFIHTNWSKLLFLEGPIDENSNEIMFYLPSLIQGDKDNQKLYIEFDLPNSMIDSVIEMQTAARDLANSLL